MDRVADGGVTWRREITPLLNAMGVVVLDPCNKPFEGAVEDDQGRSRRRELKKAGKYGATAKIIKEIRTMDLRMVDISDFLVVCIDVSVHACGTYEEITTANRQKKPVLIWCVQGKSDAPDWLFGMLPHQHIFGTMGALMEYLRRVDGAAESPRTYRRWYFPKYEMLCPVYNSGGVA